MPMSLDKSRRGRGDGDDEVRRVLAEQGGQIVGERRVIGFAGKPCRLQRRFEQIDFVRELSGQFGTEMLRIFTPRRRIQAEGMQQQHAFGRRGGGMTADGNEQHHHRQ